MPTDIKANELRVGNYVSVNGKIIKVNDIDEIGINSFVDCDFESVDYGGYFDVNKVNNPRHPVYLIEPIILNEERLLRFGYKLMKESEYTFDTFELNGVGLWNKERDFSLLIFEFSNLEVKHVHTLQNLYYALKNTELVCQ